MQLKNLNILSHAEGESKCILYICDIFHVSLHSRWFVVTKYENAEADFRKGEFQTVLQNASLQIGR